MKAHGLVRFCLPAVLCLDAWGLLRYPEQTADAVREGIQLCLNQIIPSLYGFLILTGVLLRTVSLSENTEFTVDCGSGYNTICINNREI